MGCCTWNLRGPWEKRERIIEMNNSLMAARFTVAYGCVLIAALLPIVCAAIAKWGQFNKPRREGVEVRKVNYGILGGDNAGEHLLM